ncbi:MAG: hypothetical protein K1X81_07350 [Bacteroidia bacterium]|nr:hypothetical protein [Bacteroidia bacterium]
MLKISPVILFFVLAACENVKDKAAASNKYFSLTQFANEVEADIARDTTRNFEKKVTINGKSEVKNSIKPDWNTDLELLRQMDINKPSWQLSFSQTETALPNGQLIRISASDSMPQVKEVRIVKDKKGKVREVFAIKHTQNLLYELTQSVHYFTDSLYQIKSSQKIWLLGDKEFFLETKFLR